MKGNVGIGMFVFGVLGALSLLLMAALPNYFSGTYASLFLLIPVMFFLMSFSIAIKG